MPARTPLDFDVSVSADKRRRGRARGEAGAFGAVERTCAHQGCGRPAPYRGPQPADAGGAFVWYCLDHVRERNAAWNYFAGFSPDDLDQQQRADRVWERPTWGFGQGPRGAQGSWPHAEGRAWARWGFQDPLDVLGAAATISPTNAARPAPVVSRMTAQERQAMQTLGLGLEVTLRAEVKRRYRALVKDLHPDMNGGTSPEPQRLARVIRAWDLLKSSRNLAD